MGFQRQPGVIRGDGERKHHLIQAKDMFGEQNSV
jgi:hypothetical protein